MSRESKYPPSERVSAGKLKVGDQVLIRDRQSDQPYGTSTYDAETKEWTTSPFPSGVWTVLSTSSELIGGRRKATRIYTIRLEHPGAGERTIESTPVQRFNRVVEGGDS